MNLIVQVEPLAKLAAIVSLRKFDFSLRRIIGPALELSAELLLNSIFNVVGSALVLAFIFDQGQSINRVPRTKKWLPGLRAFTAFNLND